jgi:hypothetical protein
VTSVQQRRSLLVAALGFILVDGHAAGLATACSYVIACVHRQGYDVQLTQYDERGWRATFYVTGMEHAATSATASAWGPMPWRAVQRAVPPEPGRDRGASGTAGERSGTCRPGV